MIIKYTNTISKYAKKHFIKDFIKIYSKTNWNTSLKSINFILEGFELSQKRNVFSKIKYAGDFSIWKMEFKIAGINKNGKNQGNRIILFVDDNKKEIDILLVYHKKHIPKNQKETVWWNKIINENFKNLLQVIN